MKRLALLVALLAGGAGAQNIRVAGDRIVVSGDRIAMRLWTPADLGPVAWYRADGNANDAIGGADGTWSGTELYTNGIGTSQAFAMNGASYIAIPTQEIVSVSLWANFNAISATAYFLGGVYGLRYDGTAFLLYNGGTGQTTVPWAKTNALVHMVVNHNVTTKAYDVYINGVSVGTGSAGNGPKIYVTLIGKRQDGYNFNGPIDEVIFWGRELTADEIAQVYRWRP